MQKNVTKFFIKILKHVYIDSFFIFVELFKMFLVLMSLFSGFVSFEVLDSMQDPD